MEDPIRIERKLEKRRKTSNIYLLLFSLPLLPNLILERIHRLLFLGLNYWLRAREREREQVTFDPFWAGGRSG